MANNIQWNNVSADFGSANQMFGQASQTLSNVGTIFGNLSKTLHEREQQALENQIAVAKLDIDQKRADAEMAHQNAMLEQSKLQNAMALERLNIDKARANREQSAFNDKELIKQMRSEVATEWDKTYKPAYDQNEVLGKYLTDVTKQFGFRDEDEYIDPNGNKKSTTDGAGNTHNMTFGEMKKWYETEKQRLESHVSGKHFSNTEFDLEVARKLAPYGITPELSPQTKAELDMADKNNARTVAASKDALDYKRDNSPGKLFTDYLQKASKAYEGTFGFKTNELDEIREFYNEIYAAQVAGDITIDESKKLYTLGLDARKSMLPLLGNWHDTNKGVREGRKMLKLFRDDKKTSKQKLSFAAWELAHKS